MVQPALYVGLRGTVQLVQYNSHVDLIPFVQQYSIVFCRSVCTVLYSLSTYSIRLTFSRYNTGLGQFYLSQYFDTVDTL